MNYIGFLLFLLLSFPACSEPNAPVYPPLAVAEIPHNQKLEAVDYFSNGRQTGCGLRATGVTGDDQWLNVLITVFQKESGATFGVIKVVARKANMKDGEPVMKDGRMTFTNLGKIQKAWIKSDSGKQAFVYKDGESLHSDAYMVNTEFDSTVDLLVAISRENFMVGLNREESGPDRIFQFDKRPDSEGSGKLSACMKNLRAEIEASKHRDSF